MYTNNTINNTHSIETSILIQSDAITVHYPKHIQFFGNIYIKCNNHTLTSDELTIFYNKKNNFLYTLYADGHVHYNNDYITITGQKACINLNNKNIDIYKSTYYLIKPHIHGSADTIIQRENNRYTIIKHGNFTTCLINENYWNITGSKIMYDDKKNNIDIWNARFKIKKIPIFYSPYLYLSLDKENLFKSYLPNIKYSSKYGLMFKIPCPIYLSKHISGNISPYYISNIGVQLQTKINYSIHPNSGIIILNIIKNNKNNGNTFLTKNCHKKLTNLYWKHSSITHNKWYFKTHYTTIKIPNYFENHTNITNNHINQKFICNYNHKNWNAKIAYLGIAHNSNVEKKNYHNYIAAPQITLNSCYNFYIQKIPLTLKIFNQLTKFIPEIRSYPEATRIHTEPSIHYQIHNYWKDLNIEAKLKLTHYQQKNINFYNTKKNKQYQLQNTVNRFIPQFKINGKIILKNKNYIFKKYQHFLESKLQYLYVPYCFQENIAIYDTSLIFTDYSNFFNDFTYGGLDRIAPANQITGTIVMRYLNNNHELFYISIGQILNFSKYFLNNNTNIITNTHTLPNFALFSGVIHWNINNQWNTHTEIQYDIQHHNLPCGIAILEYAGHNNYILQTHYRYINAQYMQKILLNSSDTSIYHKAISQLGIFIHTPILYNWTINCSHYFNIKTKKLIKNKIGLQYHTSCWNINASFERKIIDFNTKKSSIYDNKIKLDIKISHFKNHFISDSCKILNQNMLLY